MVPCPSFEILRSAQDDTAGQTRDLAVGAIHESPAGNRPGQSSPANPSLASKDRVARGPFPKEVMFHHARRVGKQGPRRTLPARRDAPLGKGAKEEDPSGATRQLPLGRGAYKEDYFNRKD